MPNFTSKQLILPDGPESQDVSQLNANTERLNDYGMGPFVCTSATRPTGSNRWDGMLIYETDTKSLSIYDADADRWLVYDLIWQNYVPTLAGGFTLGNGTITAKYKRVGLQIFGEFSFILGSTSAVSGVNLGLITSPEPLFHESGRLYHQIGDVRLRDTTAPETDYMGKIVSFTAQYIGIIGIETKAVGSVTSIRLSGLSASFPMPFATGDIIEGQWSARLS